MILNSILNRSPQYTIKFQFKIIKNKQVHRRGTTSSSRASSRKSSRASDGSDLSELTGPWMNLPLMLLPGTGDLVKDLKPTG